MMTEIILYFSFLLIVNLALNIDEKRKKKQHKLLTTTSKHVKVKK